MKDVRLYDKDADRLNELSIECKDTVANVAGKLIQKYGDLLLEELRKSQQKDNKGE